MPYAEETKTYRHQPFEVSPSLVHHTRELYKLTPDDSVNDSVYFALRNSTIGASIGASGGVNTWSQVLRIAKFPLRDCLDVDENTSMFMKTIEILTTGEVQKEFESGDVDLQLASSNEGINLASDAILQLLIDEDVGIRQDKIICPLAHHGYGALELHAFIDDRNWGIYTDESLVFDVTARSVAAALIRNRINGVYDSSR